MTGKPASGDSERELDMLARVRAFLRDTEGPDLAISTRLVDEVLDELNEQRRATDA